MKSEMTAVKTARDMTAGETVVRLPATIVFLIALLVAAEPALAADELFDTDSPLLKFVDFIVGPFAYGVVVVALVLTVGALAVGGEFSGFARRMPIVVVAGAIVILAETVITNLFGADKAAQWPLDDTGSGASGLPSLSPLPDILGLPLLSWQAWLVIAGFFIVVLAAVVVRNAFLNPLKQRRSGRAPGLVVAADPRMMGQPEADT